MLDMFVYLFFQPHISCTLPLDSVSPRNRGLYSLFVHTYAYTYTHTHTVFLDILMMAIHSAVQRTSFLSEAGKTVDLKSKCPKFHGILIPSFFSIPDTIGFWAECCDFEVKDTEKVVQAKMYLGASHGSFHVRFLSIFGGTERVAHRVVLRPNKSSGSLHFYHA